MVKQAQERTKVLVRKLPPGLTLDGFKAAVDKVAAGTYNWFRYHQGKVSAKQLVFSRAYLNFNSAADVYAFKTAFDGHLFVTSKGTQFRCAVEYAPHQEVPAPPTKKNPLEGTIEQDATYQAFVKALEEGPSLLPSAARQREQEERAAAAAGTAGATPAVMTTPLLEYLKERYSSTGAAAAAAARGRQRGKHPGAPTAAPAASSSRTTSSRTTDAASAAAAAASRAADSLLHRDLPAPPPLPGKAPPQSPSKPSSSRQQPGGRSQQSGPVPHSLLTRGDHAATTSSAQHQAKPAGSKALQTAAAPAVSSRHKPVAAAAPAAPSQHGSSSRPSTASSTAPPASGASAPKRVNLPAGEQRLTQNKVQPQPSDGVKLLQPKPATPVEVGPAAATPRAAPSQESGSAGDGSVSTAHEAAAAALGPPKRVRAGFQAYRPGGGRLSRAADTG